MFAAYLRYYFVSYARYCLPSRALCPYYLLIYALTLFFMLIMILPAAICFCYSPLSPCHAVLLYLLYLMMPYPRYAACRWRRYAMPRYAILLMSMAFMPLRWWRYAACFFFSSFRHTAVFCFSPFSLLLPDDVSCLYYFAIIAITLLMSPRYHTLFPLLPAMLSLCRYARYLLLLFIVIFCRRRLTPDRFYLRYYMPLAAIDSWCLLPRFFFSFFVGACFRRRYAATL